MSIESKIAFLARAFRNERGLTQDQLAEAIGKTNQTISQIEHGKVATSVDTLNAIANEMRIPLWRLFKFADETNEAGEARLATLAELFAKLETFTDQEVDMVLDQVTVIENHRP